MAIDLDKIAKEQNIKYFLISFVDLFGQLRSKMVPARAIKEMQKNGAGFAGFAAHLDVTPMHPDMLAIPDPGSLIQLPWKPEVGWLASDLWMNGEPMAASPRVMLKNQVAKAEEQGYRMKTGVECEFFLTSPDGNVLSDPLDTHVKPCYDQLALMRRYDFISEICDAMIRLGWQPYQNDHEDANGQWEMNWEYDDALKTADRHAFFKFMVKNRAEEYGFRATFMPKPFSHLTGNGCHAHMSIWDKMGKRNLFKGDMKKDSRGLGLSPLAYQFLGGIMHSADSLSALFAPTVNSYKRLSAPRTTSGATWAPSAVTYAGDNRTHMVRVPDSNRFELRLMDGSANPYLIQAGMLAAGLDGVENDRDPGDPLHDVDMFNISPDSDIVKNARHLPKTLLDSLRLLGESEVLREGLGDEFVDPYIRMKMEQWQDYASHLSEWERETTFDC